MDNIEEVPANPKSGCLKWTCLGCLGVILLGVTTCVVLWFSLTSWNKGESAWDHMPPSTTFAIEVHDVDALLSRATNDPGVQTMLHGAGEELALMLAELADEIPSSSDGGMFGDPAEFYNSYGFLYKMLLPNVATLGISEIDGEELFFCFFKSPYWVKIVLELPDKEGEIKKNINSSSRGEDFYTMVMDGWTVMTDNRELMEEIRDNWRAKALPLGPFTPVASPHISMALKIRSFDDDIAVEDDDSVPPNSFMHGGPLQGLPPQQAATTEEPAQTEEWLDSDAGYVLRGALKPDGDSWKIELEYRTGDVLFANTLTQSIDWAGLEKHGSVKPLGKADFRLIGRASETLVTEALQTLAADIGEINPRLEPAWRSTLWTWLHDAWLTRTSGDFALYSGLPAVPEKGGIVPAPVTSLAWKWARGTDSAQAALDFNDSLVLLLDAVRTSGGPLPLQAVKDSLEYEVRRDGPDLLGTVSIPAVLANAARPAWLLPTESPFPLGWLASDPLGLTAAKGKLPEWENLHAAGKRDLRLAASWSVSDLYLERLYAFFADRLPAAVDEEEAKETLESLTFYKRLLAAFPDGASDAWLDTETEHLVIIVKFSAAGQKY